LVRSLRCSQDTSGSPGLDSLVFYNVCCIGPSGAQVSDTGTLGFDKGEHFDAHDKCRALLQRTRDLPRVSHSFGFGCACLPSKQHAQLRTVSRCWDGPFLRLVPMQISFGCFYQGMLKLRFRREPRRSRRLRTSLRLLLPLQMSALSTTATVSLPPAAAATARSAAIPSTAAVAVANVAKPSTGQKRKARP
jgi:hypothetical protein